MLKTVFLKSLFYACGSELCGWINGTITRKGKNRHARRACVYRYRVGNVLLARYECRRCNKIESSKRCAIFVENITDLEIFDCRYFC